MPVILFFSKKININITLRFLSNCIIRKIDGSLSWYFVIGDKGYY